MITIRKVTNTLVDVFRSLTAEEKMDAVKHGVHTRSEDSTNGWGKWSRIIVNNKKKSIKIVKGAPVTEEELRSLSQQLFSRPGD